MKRLLQFIVEWVNAKSENPQERYLAQSVDACDFELRAQTLERARA